MNLYQKHTNLHESIINNAGYDIRDYINYIDKSIQAIASQSLPIEIRPISATTKDEYTYELANTRTNNEKLEKIFDLLFNEATMSIQVKILLNQTE
jgi:hypothetical protein